MDIPEDDADISPRHPMGVPFLLTSDRIPTRLHALWEHVGKIVPGTFLERDEIRRFIHGEMSSEQIELFMTFARENPSHMAKVMRARELHILKHPAS